MGYEYFNPLYRDYTNLNSFGDKRVRIEKDLNEYFGLLGKSDREVSIQTNGEKVLFWLYFTPYARI